MTQTIFPLSFKKMDVQNFLLIPEFSKNFYVSNEMLKKARNNVLSVKNYLGLAKILKFHRKIKTFVANCFGAVQPQVVFSTRQILYAIHEDLFPLFNKVMSYMNKCATAIAARGRTSQCLQDRIRQHVPKSIRNKTSQERKQPERQGKLANSIFHSDSAIGNYLLHNRKCASLQGQSIFYSF